MFHCNRTVLAVVLALVLGNDATGQGKHSKNTTWEDADLGIRLELPGEWTLVPQRMDYPWVAARFLCDAKSGDGLHAHFRVVVLAQDADKARAALHPDPSDPYSIRPDGKAPATYETFVSDTTLDTIPAGKHFRVDEAGKGDSPVGAYHDYKVVERTDDSFLRRARVFERDAMQVVVEGSMYFTHEQELEQIWKRVLDGIRPATKRRGAPPAVDRWLSWQVAPEDYVAWRTLPAAKRRDLRKRSESLWIQAVKQHTTSAWQVTQSRRFLVVAPKEMTTDRHVRRLEAFAEYLDRLLGPLSDDYVRTWVLRICTDEDQRDAFGCWPSLAGGFREIVLTVFDGDPDSLSCGSAQESMFWTYLHEKDALVGTVLPAWLDMGLDRALYYSSRVHGKVVDFESDDWALGFCGDLARDHRLISLRKLMTLGEDEFRNLAQKVDHEDGRLDVQCQLAVRFLLQDSGPVPLRGCMTRYLQALAEAAAGVASATDRVHFLAEARAKAIERVFGSDDDQWRVFDKGFVDSVMR
ncbi:MAG: hypothetical protein U1E73_12025 [Planctomycetota bacterium]